MEIEEEMQVMKATLSVTVESSLIAWIDREVQTQRFRNRSHLVELALTKFKASEDQR